MSSSISGYEEVHPLVERMVDRQQSGSLFIRTEDNHLAVIAIKGGEIIFLAFGAKRGASAIPLIREIGSATYQVNRMDAGYDQGELPATFEILAQLAAIRGQAPLPASAPETPVSHGVYDTQETLKALCQLLGEYMGPIASILCEEQSGNVGRAISEAELEGVIEHLSREIGKADEAQEFVTRARQLYGRLGNTAH